MPNTFFNRLVLLSISLLLFGCKNDLVLVKPDKPFPIVFCIVNPCDSFCYVSISKTFTTEQDVSKILIHNPWMKVDDAKIILEAWGSGFKLWETSFSLIEKSLPADSINTVSRSCYKSNKLLAFPNLSLVDSNQKWDYEDLRLILSSPQLSDTAYARIPIILGPGNPSPPGRMDLNLYGLDESYFRVKLDEDQTKYASFTCNLVYQEFTDHWIDKSILFIVKRDLALILIEHTLTIRLYENFFNLLIAAIKDDSSVFLRRFLYMDFELVCSDENFDDYVDTYLNVSDHDMRPFTNITNGYGIFSISRTTTFHSIGFDQQTMDSLCYGRITKKLRFKRW